MVGMNDGYTAAVQSLVSCLKQRFGEDLIFAHDQIFGKWVFKTKFSIGYAAYVREKHLIEWHSLARFPLEMLIFRGIHFEMEELLQGGRVRAGELSNMRLTDSGGVKQMNQPR